MIQTKQIDSIEPGNPFLSDLYHMGSSIGSNVVVMYGQHTRERQPYIIVCNTETGERLQIDFDPSAPEKSGRALGFFNDVLKERRENELVTANFRSIPDYGDHMTLADFTAHVARGLFIDYDGHGYYATDSEMSDIVVHPSDVKAGLVINDPRLTHVVWFNR